MQLSQQDLTPPSAPTALRYSSSRVEPLNDATDFWGRGWWSGSADAADESSRFQNQLRGAELRLDESETCQTGFSGQQLNSEAELPVGPRRPASRHAFRFYVPPETPELSQREKALQWVAENGKRFAGQWVALEGDRLLSSGPGAGDVAKAARALGVRIPSMIRIPVGEELPCAGW